MSDTRSRFAHLVPLIAVQAVGLGCGLISVRWSSAIVPPDVLGAYSLLVSAHLRGALVTHQGLIQHIQRSWTPQTSLRATLSVLRPAAGRPTLWLAAGLAGVLLFFNLSGNRMFPPGWWGWMLTVNLLVVIANLTHVALQAEQRYWAHFALSAISSTTRSFLPLGLAMVGGATLVQLGGGFVLHTVLWVLAGFWLLRRAWHRPDAPADASPAGWVSAFAGIGLCGWLAASAVRWVAPFALSAVETGYFMLAANLVAIVPSAVNMVGVGYTFPPLFEASRRGASNAVLSRMTNRAVLAALVIGQLALLALAWSSPWLVGTIVDVRYAASMDWLLPTGGGLLATVSLPFFSNLLVARDRAGACLRLAALSAGFRIVLMAALALAGSAEAFRIGLSVLAWPTLLLEWWFVRRLLRSPGA